MKKELHPAVIVVALVVIVGAIGAFFMMSGSGNAPKVDLKKLDPALLKDEDPVRRGQPGYTERITDTPEQGGRN